MNIQETGFAKAVQDVETRCTAPKKVSSACCGQRQNDEIDYLSGESNERLNDDSLSKTWTEQPVRQGEDVDKLKDACCSDARKPLFRTVFSRLCDAYGRLLRAVGLSR